MSERVFKLGDGPVVGDDVQAWQQLLHDRFRKWGIAYPVQVDGRYGQDTRAATASFMRAWGVENVGDAMSEGVTPWWRTKIRDDRRNGIERNAFDARVDYRRALREKHQGGGVSLPVARIITDSWGWHPGVHDGIDLICAKDAPLHAVCDAEVVRADTGGWWGKAPSGDVTKGDGIIILRALEDVGPIRRGMNIAYGHAEHPAVKRGDRVKAGEFIGRAGLAVVPHVHFMVNERSDIRGVGDQDPRRILNYLKEHA